MLKYATSSFQFCGSQGKRMVQIHNQKDQDSAVAYLKRSDSSLRHGYWLDLNDLGHQGTFRWDFIHDLQYSNWGPANPNNYPHSTCEVEHCAHIGFHHRNGQWNDLVCTWADVAYAFCETKP